MKPEHGQLVCQYLERIFRKALVEKYQSIVKEFVRGRHGIYVLYRKDRLYYVGLTKDLRTRLKQHLDDRHAQAWDKFSVYLTIGGQYLRDLESLILRITKPKGNNKTAKFVHSEDLRRKLKRRIKEVQNSELAEIVGSVCETPKATSKKVISRDGRQLKLSPYIDGRLKIRCKYKDKI